MIIGGVFLFTSCFNLTAQGPDYSRGKLLPWYFWPVSGQETGGRVGGALHKRIPLKPRGAAYTS